MQNHFYAIQTRAVKESSLDVLTDMLKVFVFMYFPC